MKKVCTFLAAALSLALCVGFVGCKEAGEENGHSELYIVLEDNFGQTYTIEHRQEGQDTFFYTKNISYPARFGKTLSFAPKGVYDKDNVPLEKSLYAAEYASDDLSVSLSELGSKTFDIEYTFSLTDVSTIVVTVNVNVTASEERVTDYVQIADFALPSLFGLDLEEASADVYDLSDIDGVVGSDASDSYRYGFLDEAVDGNGAVRVYTSGVTDHKTQDGDIYETNRLHSYEKENGQTVTETYQYEQTKNGTGYTMNDRDGVFDCGPYERGGLSDWLYYTPDRLTFLKEAQSLTYKALEKDGYFYLSIAGEYTSSEYYGYPNLSCEVVYMILGNTIVGGKYVETARASDSNEYWRRVRYSIPLDGDIALLDEAVFTALCSD